MSSGLKILLVIVVVGIAASILYFFVVGGRDASEQANLDDSAELGSSLESAKALARDVEDVENSQEQLDLYLELAAELEGAQEFEKAVEAYEKAITLSDRPHGLYESIAIAYDRMGEAEQANRAYDQAIESYIAGANDVREEDYIDYIEIQKASIGVRAGLDGDSESEQLNALTESVPVEE